jgi:UDP-glucose-4-epimerase GalE
VIHTYRKNRFSSILVPQIQVTVNTMKNILVVGGAGYIGSYMCKYLKNNGYLPIVLDSLVYGHRDAVQWGPFIQGSMENHELLDHIFSDFEISAVMHFAAFCYVGESVLDPAKYYHNNVAATITLLEKMLEKNVRYFIFSSTCATYGEPIHIPISEKHPQKPINPYGRSKLMVEQILHDYKTAYGLEYVALRYFNASGADPDGEVGEDHNPETHLIPLVLQVAMEQRDKIKIFGNDYPTKDGTCIRDYIHIHDLAQAHLLALARIMSGKDGGAFNLGVGNGYSVMEVIDAARKITGHPIPIEVVKRRQGDPAVLVGSNDKAMRVLGWMPQYSDLHAIVETAWNWIKEHPNGYNR